MIIEDSVLKKVEDSEIINGKFEIPEGVTSIGNSAFSFCSSLREISIPESVTSIGNSAFSFCSSLREISIPESVTSIGNSAFRGCCSLREISIPESVTSIGDLAFYGCSNLTEIMIVESVASIGNYAFYGCNNLREIRIPEGVISIGNYAFCGCSNLTEVSIPESVTLIGNSAFSFCSSLREISIPESVTSIGDSAFNGCSSLRKISIPENVTSLGNYVFEDCSSLREISIPESVTSIGDAAFCECINLREISIPKSVTSIGDSAFNGCSSLRQISIPESVTSIGNSAFRNCSGLTSVTIQNNNFQLNQYEKRNTGLLISMLFQVIREGKLESYQELKSIENEVPESQKERIQEIIYHVTKEIKIGEGVSLEEEITRAKSRVQLWINKGFIPPIKLFEKIPEEKMPIFEPKIWFQLAKEPVFNMTEESKMALVELAYVFGVFEKDKYEVRGKNKSAEEITNGEHRNGEVEDYQKRKNQILRMVKEGKLNQETLHRMFDGTNMEYNPAFYRFFLENEEAIFASEEVMNRIPKIQREMPRIMQRFRGRIPTLEECERYFSEIVYENVQEGNQELVELCKCCGITQEKFERYQELYETQKKRNPENSIPQVVGKGYRILGLKDPKALLIGEDRLSKCCQMLDGAGEECMIHSVQSENGRIFEVLDEDGSLLAQSWVWRNGNVVCFDSIEANAITNRNRYSEAEREQLVDRIEQVYRETAQKMIAETERQIADFKAKKLAEIEKLELTEQERNAQRKYLEIICDDSRIKRITVGKGCWTISQKIAERFAKQEVDTTRGRVSPREAVGYLNDSNTQYIVAETSDRGEIKTTDAMVEVKYRDKEE